MKNINLAIACCGGFLLLAGMPLSSAESADEPSIVAIQNIDDSGIAEGWKKVVCANNSTIKFIPANSDHTFPVLQFTAAAEADETAGGGAVSTRKSVVSAGKNLELSFQWKGDGLYDTGMDQPPRHSCYARVEISFDKGSGNADSYIFGADKYFFTPSGSFKSETMHLVVPDGATLVYVRIGMARGGKSQGVASEFEVGDFKLKVE